MTSPCGHDHGDDRLQETTCSAVHQLSELAGGAAAGVVIIRDGIGPAVSLKANCSNAALMALHICEVLTKSPRPTDCEACANAWGAMHQAALILRATPGRC